MCLGRLVMPGSPACPMPHPSRRTTTTCSPLTDRRLLKKGKRIKSPSKMSDPTDNAATPQPAAAKDQVGSRSKSSKWYDQEILELQPAARELLEKYSGIPPADVEAHIHDIRDKAWEIFPYPCIGGFRFLSLTLSASHDYAALLATLRAPDACVLDLGCCFGTELRKLVFDGVPPQNCVGTDLRQEFFELGYELYRDRERMAGARFFAADIFDAESAELAALDGRVDVVCAGSFFHLFDLEGQTRIAERVVRYRHDVQTWREMWDRVGRTAGVEFEVKCRMEDAPWVQHRSAESDAKILYFTVKMLG
nr:methyltransferase trt5 [Quercus suber]